MRMPPLPRLRPWTDSLKGQHGWPAEINNGPIVGVYVTATRNGVIYKENSLSLRNGDLQHAQSIRSYG